MQICAPQFSLLFALLTYNVSALPRENLVVSDWGERETGFLTAGWNALELPDGRIAIGGHSLIVFDGDRWQSFPMGNSYALRGMDLGPNGTIWAGATNELGYFISKADGTFDYHSLNEKLPEPLKSGFFTWRAFATPKGALYVTNKGVVFWDHKQFTFTPLEAQRSSVAFKIKEGVIVYSANTGGILFESEKQTQIFNQIDLNQAQIRWGFGELKKLTLITTHGVIELDERNSITGGALKSVRDPILARVTAGEELKNGRILVASAQNGLFEIDQSGEPKPVSIQGSTTPKFINGILGSQDGSAWILMRESIARISFAAQIYTLGENLKGSPVTALTEFKGLIHASNDQGIHRLQDGTFKRLQNIPESRAWALRNLNNDNLVIGSELGIGIYDGDTYYQIPQSRDVFQIGHASINSLIATSGFGMSRIDMQLRQNEKILHDLPDIPTSISDRSSEFFFFSTYSKGVYFAENTGTKFELYKATVITKGYSFKPPVTVLSVSGRTVAIDRVGVYLDTDQTAMFKFVGPSFGIVSSYSNSDDSGRVWLSLYADSESGRANRVGRISVNGENVIWEPLDLDFPNRNGSPYSLFCDGRFLWIGTEFGVVKHPIDKVGASRTPRAPLLFISGDNGPHPGSPNNTFPFGTRVRVDYASLEYSSREALRFQTFLSGFDKSWSEPNNDPTTRLDGLREGVYEFSVRAAIDGVASDSATIRFIISPPWWRSDLAYLIYALLAVGAISAGVRIRERAQRERTATLESSVRRRTEQLHRANEAKTDFVTAMSHDVRTPINGIVGSTIELSRSHLDLKQRALVQRIEACSNMLCTLVEDVLDFAAIEAGQTLITDRAFSPVGLLNSIGTILRASAPQSGCLIECEADDNVPRWLIGDESRIRQIMVNYGSNAVKYAGADIIKLRVKRDGSSIVFSVADRGPGISEQAQRKLFLRFSRVTPDAGKDGRGLGLAGCRAIARLMNGAVGVDSKAGEGAEFWLRIPMRESLTWELPSDSKAEVKYDQRALLVEDVYFSAEASRAVLEAVGFEVVVVGTGRAAIERVRHERFDVVFLDVSLPDVSGMAVAAALRSDGGLGSTVRILATTAHSTVDHKAECIRSGMSGFISKPLTPEKVHHALARAKSFSATEGPREASISFAMLEFLSKGSTGELRKHADMLLSGIDEDMSALSAAVSYEDRECIKRIAHRLITHARLAGAQNLIEMAATLESTASHESMDSISDQILKVRSAIAVVRSKLEAHVLRAESA